MLSASFCTALEESALEFVEPAFAEPELVIWSLLRDPVHKGRPSHYFLWQCVAKLMSYQTTIQCVDAGQYSAPLSKIYRIGKC